MSVFIFLSCQMGFPFNLIHSFHRGLWIKLYGEKESLSPSGRKAPAFKSLSQPFCCNLSKQKSKTIADIKEAPIKQVCA